MYYLIRVVIMLLFGDQKICGKYKKMYLTAEKKKSRSFIIP